MVKVSRRALVAPQGASRTQSLPQGASTDAAGQYQQLRVGPGRYRILGFPDHVSSEEPHAVENQNEHRARFSYDRVIRVEVACRRGDRKGAGCASG